MKADVDQKSGGVKADLAGRSVVAPSRAGASIVRSRLFFKYTVLFVDRRSCWRWSPVAGSRSGSRIRSTRAP